MEWGARARRAALALNANQQPEEESRGVQLLMDIRAAFDADSSQRLPTVELLRRITAMEASPWGEYRDGRPLSSHQLARLLRPYGIGVTTYRRDSALTVKGYLRSAFDDAWNRYAPSSTTPPIGNTVTAGADAQPGPEARADGSYRVTDRDDLGDGSGGAGHEDLSREDSCTHQCAHRRELDCSEQCETEEQLMTQIGELRRRNWSPEPGGAHVDRLASRRD
jgi:hypothetical protein